MPKFKGKLNSLPHNHLCEILESLLEAEGYEVIFDYTETQYRVGSGAVFKGNDETFYVRRRFYGDQ